MRTFHASLPHTIWFFSDYFWSRDFVFIIILRFCVWFIFVYFLIVSLSMWKCLVLWFESWLGLFFWVLFIFHYPCSVWELFLLILFPYFLRCSSDMSPWFVCIPMVLDINASLYFSLDLSCVNYLVPHTPNLRSFLANTWRQAWPQILHILLLRNPCACNDLSETRNCQQQSNVVGINGMKEKMWVYGFQSKTWQKWCILLFAPVSNKLFILYRLLHV